MLIEVRDMTTGFINRTNASINFLNLETEFYKILQKNIIQASHMNAVFITLYIYMHYVLHPIFHIYCP